MRPAGVVATILIGQSWLESLKDKNGHTVPESLRGWFLAALGGNRPNSLFFAGDLGQRIFQQPFPWKALGVDIRDTGRYGLGGVDAQSVDYAPWKSF